MCIKYELITSLIYNNQKSQILRHLRHLIS